MAEIVNLNKARKARSKAAAKAEAEANRAKHGRAGAQKANDRQVAARLKALLDGARREDGEK